jgi:hypothetical protein
MRTIKSLRPSRFALLIAALLVAPAAWGQVVVEIIGNTAHATIALANETGSYDADVTIVFDTPTNLTAQSLNLTAELVDPNDPAFTSRLPAGFAATDFPMMVTVEPPDTKWVFTSGFDDGNSAKGPLQFLNSYELEIHTHNLVYEPDSVFRLLKAPLGASFADVTQDIRSGSTRARGRGGAFSQFVIAQDTRQPSALIALGKAIDLDLRLVGAILNSALRLQLVTLLVQVETALLLPILGCNNALAPLDNLITTIQANAGIGIANEWHAQHDVINDAGELESLAVTLRFSVLGCATP